MTLGHFLGSSRQTAAAKKAANATCTEPVSTTTHSGIRTAPRSRRAWPFARAHSLDPTKIQTLSVDAKSVLGIFADFVHAKRTALLNGGMPNPDRGSAKAEREGSGEEQASKQDPNESQVKLL